MWLVNHSRVHVCATLRPFLSTKYIQKDQVSTYSQASNKQAGPFAIGDSEAKRTDKRTDVWSRPSCIYTQIPLKF